eukprot:TRINITY_DN4449_c0_g1_i3.p1 TRINITY_DN4449_c0_g1~~TRINITY_DN4449_c0_g1_i3.p1  ORF type:complete len:293 (+),score=65.57 TRINITY_DN4449_c0_g1_i3:52-930(+)
MGSPLTSLPTLAPIARLSSRVITVLGLNPGPFTLTGTNTYIVGTGEKRILIDAAEGVEGFTDNLDKAMKDGGCKSLDSILITHWHHDHVDGLPSILQRFGKSTVWKMKRPHNDETPQGIEYEFLNDGQVFKVEGATLRAIHTPGHSDDHTCFYFEEEKALFGGDCVLGIGSAVFNDLYSYMHSLKTILDLKPERIYSAHGPLIENGVEKIQEYIHHRQAREGQIVAALRSQTEAMPLESLVNTIYGELPPPLFHGAMNNLNLHLRKLLKDGIVTNMNESEESRWIINPHSSL